MVENITRDKTSNVSSPDSFLKRTEILENAIEESLIFWKLKDCFSTLESYENELFIFFEPADQKEINILKENITYFFNRFPGIGDRGKDASGRSIMVGGLQCGNLRHYLVKLNQKLRTIKHNTGLGVTLTKKGGEDGIWK